MQIETLATIVTALSAAGGLIYTAIQIGASNKTQQLQLLESFFKEIKSMEQLYYEKYLDEDQEKKKKWAYLFFNQIEWFAFLINNKKIKDKKLISFFKDAVISWHDVVFIKHFDKTVVDDENKFKDFKKLYHTFKKQQSSILEK